ncbi:unnamed protein product [Tilletia controversa]|uniref:Uncharacterized protein n=1 Tax=Tilletia controversa TaxID=13291 RepID=A0A8X7SU57_9BASI|nr:hypothetical protein A4X06_0g7505 [Tilletia controversa]CAD6982374.1 unnamed protein product [Tilletia controversa]
MEFTNQTVSRPTSILYHTHVSSSLCPTATSLLRPLQVANSHTDVVTGHRPPRVVCRDSSTTSQLRHCPPATGPQRPTPEGINSPERGCQRLKAVKDGLQSLGSPRTYSGAVGLRRVPSNMPARPGSAAHCGPKSAAVGDYATLGLSSALTSPTVSA